MTLSQNEIEALAAKMIDGTISSVEQEQMNAWLNQQMSKDSYVVDQRFASNSEELKQRILTAIIQRTIPTSSQPESPRKMVRPWLAAASILLIACCGLYFYSHTIKQDQEKIVNIQPDDVQPGGNKAILTLNDGRAINLDESQSGIIMDNNHVKYQDGKTAVIDAERSGDNAAAQMLTLSTPKGGTYQVVLPDGSRVWINANSKLSYPRQFKKNERSVSISGEAYFSVVKNKKAPFIVTSNGQQVKVLGTEFNITSYPDEADTKTTLVEGSVRIEVLNSLDGRFSLLKPGEQATLQAGIIGTKPIDTEQFTAWKDGFFYFDGLSPQVAFAQLSRWYDIDVIYQGTIPSVSFFGMIDRKKSLGSILKILEKGGVKFKVNQKNNRKRLLVFNE